MSRATDTTNRADKVREIHQQLEDQVAELVSGEDWAAMLELAGRFHNYSANNVMLIAAQRPDATRVAGYKTWQSMGRQVSKGEHGIRILAPCPYKVTDNDGEETRVVRGFRVVSVFDVAQTDGDELPGEIRPTLLEGEAPEGLWNALAKQVAEAGFMLERGDCHGANGTTNYATRVVTVRDDVSEAQACKTLAHELGHVLLHDGTAYAMGCRGRVEVEAESVAYVVAAASGLPTEGYSLPYVAHWANGDAKVVRETAERVIGTARAILGSLEAEAVAA